ncbi:uncharacterized protein LOC125545531 isoform X1 [Triticum urartu]|uniref:uncharacterized protein LOC125545531 isoform X1 n=1 Tax=Triticum urartu TaxID=4572 RepID=UPI002042DACA|nr:uncharacterized protein LOC125545531 isoform X1 [Triticum urartu]
MVEVGEAAHREAPGDAASLRRQQRRPASVRSPPPKPDGVLSGEGPDLSSSSRVLGRRRGRRRCPPAAACSIWIFILVPSRRSSAYSSLHTAARSIASPALPLTFASSAPSAATAAGLIAGPAAGRGALDPAGGGALGRRPPRRRLLDHRVNSQLLYRLMLRLYCSPLVFAFRLTRVPVIDTLWKW